jgi:hypothetical protein
VNGVAVEGVSRAGISRAGAETAATVDAAAARAISMTDAGDAAGTARLVAAALAAAPAGNAGWLLPIEPLLGVQRHRAAWTPALAILCTRAM